MAEACQHVMEIIEDLLPVHSSFFAALKTHTYLGTQHKVPASCQYNGAAINLIAEM